MSTSGLRRGSGRTHASAASAALMAGVPPAYIAGQLGHSVKMLLDTYARWIPGNDAGGAKAMLIAAMAGADSSQQRPNKTAG